MYEDITYESILQRMLDRIPNTLDKREGSIIYDALAPAAMELKLAYIEFDQILNESFADTASRDFLIRRCAERGIIPQEKTKAILKGEFTPTNIDLIGQRFNLDKLNYIVVEKIEDGVYQVECETAGSEGNQYFGTLIPIEYVEGLQTAQLTELLIPAEDDESVESLRNRYYNSFNSRAFGGNKQDYLDKVNNSAYGVGSVKVTPIWNGAGTVRLTILDAAYNQADLTLLQNIQNEIDPTQDGLGVGLAPIGHIVTVDTVEEIPISVVSKITFDTGFTWESLKSQIETAVSDYFLELREDWGNQEYLTVRISHIEARLVQIEGITDVAGTTVNGHSASLQLAWNEIPILNGVSGGDS